VATVYLGIGSNLGDRTKNIQDAVSKLNTNGISVKKVSTIIETDPVGGPPQGKFLNGAIEAQTTLTAPELHATLKKIEKDLGRVDTIRNGPRTIDIDILLYDELTFQTSTLTIPHLRMLERDFVMTPLKEIAPAVAKRIQSKLPLAASAS